ncbi:MAG TPA: glycosyltransferase family 1 protein [Mycobacteriales bacterium]|nr:glycosyltransferase family 1 protein [Mycobacteriales bacterium]
MDVALDARWMQLRPLGGVGRILANVLPHVPAGVDLTLLTDPRWPELHAAQAVMPLRAPWPGHAAAWLQWSAPRWLREFTGVFHCPFYALPFRQSVPMVVTIHDLTFEDHPEWFPRGRAWSYRAQARHAARTADVVMTVSEHVRDRIAERYGVPQERLVVASPAVDPVFLADHDVDAVRRQCGVNNRYVVALGGGPRRNLGLALEAWERVRRRHEDVELVVVGRAPAAEAPGVRTVGAVDDDTWAALLAGAAALLYPTSDEGFGMPALEAAASGTPVVCIRAGALPEVLADAAMWVDTLTAEALAAGLERLLTDAAGADALTVAGRRRAAELPGWEVAAARHVQAWTAAAESGRRNGVSRGA